MLGVIGFLASCGDDVLDIGNYYLNDFSELTSIEKTLVWDSAYDANIDVVSPAEQKHYKHTLTINHTTKTVTDVLKEFTGEDSSTMTTSTVERGEEVYNKLKGYLENIVYLENTIGEVACSGGAEATIDFETTNGATDKTVYSYHAPEETCQPMHGNYQLSSKEFSDYLSFLQTDRN